MEAPGRVRRRFWSDRRAPASSGWPCVVEEFGPAAGTPSTSCYADPARAWAPGAGVATAARSHRATCGQRRHPGGRREGTTKVVLHLAAYGAYEKQADAGHPADQHPRHLQPAGGRPRTVAPPCSSTRQFLEYGFKSEPMREADRFGAQQFSTAVAKAAADTPVQSVRPADADGHWSSSACSRSTAPGRNRPG